MKLIIDPSIEEITQYGEFDIVFSEFIRMNPQLYDKFNPDQLMEAKELAWWEITGNKIDETEMAVPSIAFLAWTLSSLYNSGNE